jgi:ribosome-associated protein
LRPRWAEVPQEVPIRGEMIRLGQLLKLAGVVETGAEARALVAEARVRVNGEPETRHGRQLAPGDGVKVGELELRVSRQPD